MAIGPRSPRDGSGFELKMSGRDRVRARPRYLPPNHAAAQTETVSRFRCPSLSISPAAPRINSRLPPDSRPPFRYNGLRHGAKRSQEGEGPETESAPSIGPSRRRLRALFREKSPSISRLFQAAPANSESAPSTKPPGIVLTFPGKVSLWFSFVQFVCFVGPSPTALGISFFRITASALQK